MTRWLRFTVIALVAWGFWSIPVSTQTDTALQYSVRANEQIAGLLVNQSSRSYVSFSVSREGSMLTLRVDLDTQSVLLRKGNGELHISSSLNRGGVFATLSGSEKRVIGEAVDLMDQDPSAASALHVEMACLMRQLSAWPATMPVAVDKDAVRTTVGTLSVLNTEIADANARALAELSLEGEEEALPAASIVSFCAFIGRTKAACYPISLTPYVPKCETVLVGGTGCRGRCGTVCNGLCTGQRYTADCLNHDRCVGVLGQTHPNCNFIFTNAFDDCTMAPSCTDAGGAWTLKYTFKGESQKTGKLYVFPDKKFRDTLANKGTWAVTGATLKLTQTTGCKAIFTGMLNANRIGVTGSMKCGTKAGTWSATKTETVLPPS